MGTTLTGTTPQDTYDSLIKVTDNGPLSGTAKYLSDGLGNDSALAVSTTAVAIGTTTAAGKLNIKGSAGSGLNLTHSNNTVVAELVEFSGAQGAGFTLKNAAGTTNVLLNAGGESYINGGNVGIGTSSPATRLHVAGADAWLTLQRTSGTTNIIDFTDSAAARIGYVGAIASNITINAAAGNSIIFAPNNAEAGRFTSNGLTFNGDTAAANALDDYEEGTWTMGVSFGGASVGVTTNLNTGAYTKVGNKVTVTGFLQLSSKGSSTGVAKITGLPFTLPANLNRLSAPSLWFNNITFANQFQGYCDQNSTNIDLYEITEAGVATALTNADFANNSEIMLSATYFV